jgi:hypothetical protein
MDAILLRICAGIVLAQQWICEDLKVFSAPELNNYGVLLYRKPTLEGRMVNGEEGRKKSSRVD